MRRSILLVLASVRLTPGRSVHLPRAIADRIFAGLAAGVREVDFLGWYQQDRVAGAVLAQAGYLSDRQAGRVSERILPAIRRELRDGQAQFIHVRVVRLGAMTGH